MTTFAKNNLVKFRDSSKNKELMIVYRTRKNLVYVLGTRTWSTAVTSPNSLQAATSTEKTKLISDAKACKQHIKSLFPLEDGDCLELTCDEQVCVQTFFGNIFIKIRAGETVVYDNERNYNDYSYDDDSEEDDTFGTGVLLGRYELPASLEKFIFPKMNCYSIRLKNTFHVTPTYIKHHTFQQNALNNVVISDEYKQSLQELTHIALLKNNLNGVNILLHGPPGCGKTYTAHMLAEHCKRAIFYIDGRDASGDAYDFEEKIGKALKKAAEWRAVLLIDEADAILKSRGKHDTGTDAVTAVMLRLLEQHTGIIVMTSNRAFEIDAAFASRINLILKYDQIDESQRFSIWKKQLQSNGIIHFSDEDVADIAKMQIDGRGIKLSLSNAISAAAASGNTVDVALIKRMIRTRATGLSTLQQ